MRIAVGFSGGVDSATAALLLREQGHDVHGVMMSVQSGDGAGCGAGEDPESALLLARRIGIPLDIVDCSRQYRELVLDYFRSEYLAGRTPNPCVRCNALVKFSLLPDLWRQGGGAFDRFATGHYARVEFRPDLGRHVLMRGIDHTKDQSYFLYRLDESQLARTLFPLGGMTKSEVRSIAEARGLPVHDKPDSQDFHAGEYGELIGRPEAEGEIVDMAGAVLGRHPGYWHFTPGQRKGLGVAHTEPLYVVRVEPATNRVVVGTRAQQLRPGCRIAETVFHLPEPRPGDTLRGRLRSSQPLREMTVGERDGDGNLAVHFASPQQGVAPGQSLVLYRDDTVVGGGIITTGL